MDDRAKKMLVVIIGVALFGGIVVWRSIGAFSDKKTNTDWDAMLKKDLVARGPENVPYTGLMVFKTPPPYAVKLGTLRMPQRLERAKKFLHSENVFLPVIRAVKADGGNALVHERVDDSAADLPVGWADLVDTAYFVHVGPQPDEWRQRLGGRACMIMAADGVFAKAGLETGDLLVDVDHAYRDAGWPGRIEGCAARDRIEQLPKTQPVTLTVLRGGTAADMWVARDRRSFFESSEVPILTLAQIATLPVSTGAGSDP